MLEKLWKYSKILLSVAAGSLIFYWIFGYASLSTVVKTFLGINWIWSIIFLVISFLLLVVLAWRWQIILHYHGYDLPLWSIFPYSIMGFTVGYVTPMPTVGGEPIRALMVQRHGVPSKDAWSSVILDKALELASNIFFGAIGVVMVFVSFNVPKLTYGLLVVAFLCTMYFVVKFFMKLKNEERMFLSIANRFHLMRFKFAKKLFSGMNRVEQSMSEFMKKSMRGFIYALLLSGVLWLLMFFEYWVVLKMFGATASIAGIFLIGTFIGLALMAPVPGSLGVLEGSQVSLFSLLKLGAGLGMSFSLVIRGRDLLKTLFGLWYLSHFGVNLLGKKGKKFKGDRPARQYEKANLGARGSKARAPED